MYEDNPYWRVYFNLLKGLYHEHPVRKDIAGTVESIYKINKEILYECYRTFYHPSNMVLFIAGDVDTDRVIKQAEELFSKQPVRRLEVRLKEYCQKRKKEWPNLGWKRN